MRRIMLVNMLFGLWLMLAPFILSLINKSVVRVRWEDLLLGFGIAAFALCRMLSRRAEEIAIADSIVTALASLTLLNPILYGYFRLPAAAWNNIVIGAAVFLLTGRMALAWTAKKSAAAVDYRFGASRKHDFRREITSQACKDRARLLRKV
jgi:hypothetical protein